MSGMAWTAEQDAEFRSAADGEIAQPKTHGHLRDATAGLELLSIADLARLPPPEWLVESILPRGGFSVLFGPSGTGKSFLALDWSLCVAAGLAWYGRQACEGGVLYVAAEGVAGLYPRVAAWLDARNQSPPDAIRFVPAAINLLYPVDVDRAREAITRMPHPPALIVIDTMARSMVGGDENAARDVGMFIASVDELRRDTGAASLIVHHTGKNGEDERGSSALRGAADALLALKPDGASLRLECVKAKDAEPFDPWRLHLQTALKSCVLALGTNSGRLSTAEREILDSVSASFGTKPASATAIRDASGVAKSSFYRSLKTLVDRGYIDTVGDGRGALYALTPEGREQLVPVSPNESRGTSVVSPTRPSLYGTVGLRDETGPHDQMPVNLNPPRPRDEELAS
jgi:DNA-binding MarR family transcriptional regulator